MTVCVDLCIVVCCLGIVNRIIGHGANNGINDNKNDILDDHIQIVHDSDNNMHNIHNKDKHQMIQYHNKLVQYIFIAINIFASNII